jgi:hypothetical protein
MPWRREVSLFSCQSSLASRPARVTSLYRLDCPLLEAYEILKHEVLQVLKYEYIAKW